MIAGIRPAFKTMLAKLINRESFDYGIKILDQLLQTKEMPDSFLLYQEQIMKILSFSGFSGSETYPIIKAISKKKVKVIKNAKEQFVSGFSKRILESSKEITEEKAKDVSNKVWQIIEDSSSYGFNASHAYCMALDSLYGAYLKAHHTYDFFVTICEFYAKKKDNNRVSSIIKEMETCFNIKMGDMVFGVDNRSYVADKKNHTIYPSLLGVKNINIHVAEALYQEGLHKEKYTNFYDLYLVLNGYTRNNKKTINKTAIETLIKIGYFKDYGTPKQLLNFLHLIQTIFKKKQYNKNTCSKEVLSLVSRFARTETDALYKDLDKSFYPYLLKILPAEKFALGPQLKNEIELTGTTITTVPGNIAIGEVVARSYKKNVFLFKSWKNNSEVWINTHTSKEMPEKGEIILLYNVETKEKRMGRKTRTDYYAEIELMKKAKKK